MCHTISRLDPGSQPTEEGGPLDPNGHSSKLAQLIDKISICRQQKWLARLPVMPSLDTDASQHCLFLLDNESRRGCVGSERGGSLLLSYRR